MRTVDPLELRQQRAKLIAEARAILERAETEGRSLDGQEEEQWRKLMNEAEGLRNRIEMVERQQVLDRELDRPLGAEAGGREQPADPEGRGGNEEEARQALRRFLRAGIGALSQAETRALQVGRDDLGGYITAPRQFVRVLIKAVDDRVFIRTLATTLELEVAESLGVPSLDTDLSDADWTSELATGTEDTSLRFGKRELRPHPLAKRIKASNKLLRQAAMDPEALIRDRLAYKFGVTEEKAFMVGDGVNKPLGVFVATADGISTSRDVSSGNSTTAIAFDGLIAAKYALKTQYWPEARWAFHRTAVEQIAKLKDNNGQYIWRESVRTGEPDRLLGLPVEMSEYVPNTFTAGKYVGSVGAWRHYWIVDALDMQLQRLVELYAEQNQVGFIARRELDGMPVLEEAFVRVTLAAA